MASAPTQTEMFAPTEMRKGCEPPLIDPNDVRSRLTRALDALKACEVGSPWSEEATGRNIVIFPQMANWLPRDEADTLRNAFRAELVRLDLVR